MFMVLKEKWLKIKNIETIYPLEIDIESYIRLL